MQGKYFIEYLSTAPVLAILTLVVLSTLLIYINYYFPDILFFTKP
jgi:hypothetical protein